jgi:hypothetical protein
VRNESERCEFVRMQHRPTVLRSGSCRSTHDGSDLPDAEAFEGTAVARDRWARKVLPGSERLSQRHNGPGQGLEVAGHKGVGSSPVR